MPLYEYVCPTCRTRFELLRPMSRSDETATCPQGHPGAARAISVFAAPVRESGGASIPMGGGCACGGACACGA